MMIPANMIVGNHMIGRLASKKTFCITGHRGFIGSYFTQLCLGMGHRVIGFDKLTYAANRDINFDGDFSEYLVDINDIDELPYCDIIVNCAAESHVDNSITDNSHFMKSNVLGVHHLLELLKNKKINNMMHSWSWQPPLFVQISTDEVFGDIHVGAFKEDDRHRPSNPYSATKACAEQLVVAWGRTYGLPYIITRTTNNMGVRQHNEKLIPSAITRLLSGKKAMMHGNGSYVRNWISVLDNVDAIYRIIDVGQENESYHISSNEEYSVEHVIRKICTALSVQFETSVDTSTDRSGADVRYALDSSKTCALGWYPKRSFDDELHAIITSLKEKCRS